MFGRSGAHSNNDPRESSSSSVGHDSRFSMLKQEISEGESGPLSNEGLLERSISCEGFTVRFAVERDRVVHLEVDVTHPGFPGAKRVFLLSPLLDEAYAISPETVAQVVSESSSIETRLDALKLVASHFSPECRARLVWRDSGVVEKDPSPDICDEFEPAFAISQRPTTQWTDFIEGRTRRAVTVWRNDKPFVEFCVAQDSKGDVYSASMLLVRVELNWPLLTKSGLPVSKFNVWKSIDQYIEVLQKSRLFAWPSALEELAREQERRSGAGADPDESREFYVQQVLVSINDENAPVLGPGEVFQRFFAAVSDVGYVGAMLPDGRTLWMSMPGPSEDFQSLVIHWAGLSCSGGDPFLLRVTFDGADLREVRAACGKCFTSGSWNDIEKGLQELASIPSGRLSIIEPPSPETCPRIINQLVDYAKLFDGDGASGVGIFGEREISDPVTRLFMTKGMVRGATCMHAYANHADLSQSWLCEALLDENLEGELLFTNKLGGRFVLSMDENVGDVARRFESLKQLIECIYLQPERLRHKAQEVGVKELWGEVLPTSTNGLSYQMLNQIAMTWFSRFSTWESSYRLRFSRQQVFRVQPLPDNRWAISRCQNRLSVLELSYHTLIVGDNGVEEAYYSAGKRNLLGALTGVRLVPIGNHGVFSQAELFMLFSLMQKYPEELQGVDLRSLVLSHLPYVAVEPAASMRHIDLERDTRDLWVRMVNAMRWVAGIFIKGQ